MTEAAGLVDDTSIPDEAMLWRRIPPWHVVFDDNAGRLRPKSAAFDDHPDGSPMSVVLAEAVLDEGREPDSVLAGHAGFALVAITAGFARLLGLGVVRRPVEGEAAHVEVFGRKTKSVKKALARAAVWVVAPVTPD